jgi:hypothetical protein
LGADLLSSCPYTLEEVLSIFLGLFLLVLIVSPFYILGSIGLMVIARRRGLKHERYAWVPLARSYLLGEVAFEDKRAGFVFVGLQIISFIFGSSKGYGRRGADSSLFVFRVMAYHEIYKRMSDKAVLMTIATVLSLGLLGPIFLFAIRNNAILEMGERKLLQYDVEK